MSNPQFIRTAAAAPKQEHESDARAANATRRAAAIEAAYILEAVRK